MSSGRQRQFDERVALDAAMEVFWSNGYSSTSLSDVTDAMGINKPSLYAAFGNKEALFLRALNRYIDKHGSEPSSNWVYRLTRKRLPTGGFNRDKARRAISAALESRG